MSKLSGIRVFGGVVNSPQSYVDYNIVGTDEEGQIHLENVDDESDEVVWDNEKVQEVFKDGLAINGGDIPIPSDKVWDEMDNLTKLLTKNTYNNFAVSEIKNAQESLFLAVVEEGMDN